MSNNIVKFPKGEAVRPHYVRPNSDFIKAAIRWPRPNPLGVLAWLYRAGRVLLFFVLYWLRPIIVGLSNLISSVTLLGFLVDFFLVPADAPIRGLVWSIAGVSLATFVFGRLFDFFLFSLAPAGAVVE